MGFDLRQVVWLLACWTVPKKRKPTPAKRLRARKGSLSSKQERVSPMGPQTKTRHSAGMLGRCNFQSRKKVGIRAECKLNKTDVPVLGRVLSRIKLGRPAWDRAQKDSIRAALVSGRGASTIRGKTVRDSSGDVFRDGSKPIRDDPYLPLLRAFTQMPRPTRCLLAACRGGRQLESDGMFLIVNCARAVERVGYELLD
eukprot:1148302-Pelagomonas_calceolata.AAC.2